MAPKPTSVKPKALLAVLRNADGPLDLDQLLSALHIDGAIADNRAAVICAAVALEERNTRVKHTNADCTTRWHYEHPEDTEAAWARTHAAEAPDADAPRAD